VEAGNSSQSVAVQEMASQIRDKIPILCMAIAYRRMLLFTSNRWRGMDFGLVCTVPTITLMLDILWEGLRPMPQYLRFRTQCGFFPRPYRTDQHPMESHVLASDCQQQAVGRLSMVLPTQVGRGSMSEPVLPPLPLRLSPKQRHGRLALLLRQLLGFSLMQPLHQAGFM
jgi:hypothetical protein